MINSTDSFTENPNSPNPEDTTEHMDFRKELARITPVLKENPDARIYVFGAGRNWKNICDMCKHLAAINIDNCIDGFIDNDTAKQGTTFHGKRVYAISEIDTTKAVILISVASWPVNHEILFQLLSFGMYEANSVFTVDTFFNILMRYGYKRLLQFKDKHRGQRCFIIGNGPSLSASDLDKLKNEISFGTNMIFLMFDKTEWRPSYYVCEEDMFLSRIQNEILTHIKCPKICSLLAIFRVPDFSLTDFYFYYFDWSDTYKPDRTPRFSEEPFFLKSWVTVTYSCIQFAAYMGFSEIYLLGVDWTPQARMVKLNGEISFGNQQTHFSGNYKPTDTYTSKMELGTLAFKSAREYCDANGIKIRNATRGGALEVFERVDFDGLF